jgi:hypothetical protein
MGGSNTAFAPMNPSPSPRPFPQPIGDAAAPPLTRPI